MNSSRSALRSLFVLLVGLATLAVAAQPDVTAFEPVRDGVYGPRDEIPLPTSVVRIQPEQDIQATIAQHPRGSTFLLEAGTYRQQTLRLRLGDVLIGEPGATLNGSQVVSGFSPEGDLWTASVPTWEGEPSTFECVDEVVTCNLPELLFVDDALMTRAATREDVTSGTWFFDTERGRLYLADDPEGKLVELSLPLDAPPIRGARDATLRNLRIVKYALEANDVAVRTAPGMRVEDNEISFNGGIGLVLRDGVVARGNRIVHNGQYGVTASNVDRGVLERNEIAFNNTRRFSFFFNGGGSKFSRTQGLVVRENHVHHNVGPGLWTDVENYDAVIQGNIVSDNVTHGIFHEISGEALIRNNLVARNQRHGIYISSSFDVRVTQNLLVDNRSGLVARTNCRRGGANQFRVENVEFYDNTVYQSGSDGPWVWGKAASLSIAPECDAWDDAYVRSYFTNLGNAFFLNTYYLSDGADFVWNNQQIDYRVWQQLGQDWDGIVVPETEP